MTSASVADSVSAMNDSNRTPSNPTIRPSNESERTDDSESERVHRGFLTLLEDDIQSNPEKLIVLDSSFVTRLDLLIGGIDVDISSQPTINEAMPHTDIHADD